MKTALHIWLYVILVGAFLYYKFVETFGAPLPFFQHYFEDLIAMPIFLKTGLLVIQLMNVKWNNYVILKRDILILTVLTGVYFEFIIPRYDVRFTTDLLDLAAYATGSVFFMVCLNKPLQVKVKVS